ncbi:MAG: type II secretion system protein GspM [Gallionella sp.]
MSNYWQLACLKAAGMPGAGSLKHYWELTRIRVEALAVRERVMVLAAAVVLLLFLVNLILINPLLTRQKTMSAQLAQQHMQMRELQVTLEAVQQFKRDDAHSPERARIAQLKAQLNESNRFLQTRSDHLVDSRKIGQLLEQMLRGNWQLVELKTLPVSLLIEPVAGGRAVIDEKSMPKIYKHGVQVTVRGSYQDLLNYLVALEKMPLFWGEVSVSAAKYPDAVMTLTVYTLSPDKHWLKV